MSDIKSKLEKIRGGGHHIAVGLDDILEDFDKRIAALEPKKAEAKAEPKAEAQSAKSTFVPNPPQQHVSHVETNPLDGTNLKD